MLASYKRFTGAVALAVVASGLALLPLAPASANPAGTGLVISEVYGGGGNTGATYNNDFVELYNPTDAAITRRRAVHPVPLRHRQRRRHPTALPAGNVPAAWLTTWSR